MLILLLQLMLVTMHIHYTSVHSYCRVDSVEEVQRQIPEIKKQSMYIQELYRNAPLLLNLCDFPTSSMIKHSLMSTLCVH